MEGLSRKINIYKFKHMKYIIVFVFLFVLTNSQLDAQTSIVPFVAKVSNADYKLCQSGGEPVVSSVLSKSISLTQGFLQPDMAEIMDIYIPNIFAPDLVGDNKLFSIGIKEDAPIMISKFVIFNNFHETLYEVDDVDPNTFQGWWDGTSGGEKVDTGIYRYQIQYTINGISKTREGSITKL